MLLINAPHGVDPSIWNMLNDMLRIVPDENFLEFLSGIQDGVNDSRELLEHGSDQEIVEAMNDDTISLGEAKFHLRRNIKTMDKWIETYRKVGGHRE